MSDDGEKKKQSPLVWILGGCGGVALLGLCGMCVAPRVLGLLFTGSDFFGGGPTPVAYPTPALPMPDAAGVAGGPFVPMVSGPVRPLHEAIDPSTDLAPRRVFFVVTGTRGARAPGIGAECAAVIERRVEGTDNYRCHAEVTCDGNRLYGGESHGFFPCQLLLDSRRNVTGNDTALTAGDGDAVFEIDTTVDRVHLADDASGTFGEYSLDGTVLRIE